FEAIDAVRGMTNVSSGKMGYALAHAALNAGAEVTLVSGPVCIKPPVAAKCINVVSARDMMASVKKEIPHTDIFISVAAVADYRATKISKQKIKKTEDDLTLALTPNPDILKYVANLKKAPFCVGFAAETENIERNAELKRRNKKLPLLIANKAQDAIGSDECALILLGDNGKKQLAKAPKTDQARLIINHISSLYKNK
ncbi:MAG: phosphopantothenate synthase, partial [Nitrosomonas sp.]|nr:phosphopantothenate synthase [Nitrosomonas sp.]